MDLIPDELRRALEDHEVVFVCGAGVSTPAGLPSFKGLVECVLKNLTGSKGACKPGTPEAAAWIAFENDRYDEALNILEHPRGGIQPEDVRKIVKAELDKKPRTLRNHLILARLADLDEPHGRLVTTNFDLNFTKAAKRLRRKEGSGHRTKEFIAPALPPAKPRTFSGLNYLHGRLLASENESGLVLTTTDFGSAYMLEGWARRFIIDLSRHHYIVFIGYRVEDPTMRYLVSAIAAARSENREHFKEPYAFAPYGEEDDNLDTKEAAEQEWDLKGISSIPYDAANHHQLLWTTLDEWANDHRMDIASRRYAALTKGQLPPSDDRHDDIQEFAWALRNRNVAKFIGQAIEDRPHPGWIPYLQESGLLSLPVGSNDKDEEIPAPLVSDRIPDHLDLDETTLHLGRWIAKCVDSQEALDWAITQGGVLHRKFRREIQSQLYSDSKFAPPALRKIWRVLADDGYAHSRAFSDTHGVYPTYPKLGPENFFAIRTFLDCLRPIPVFSKASRSSFERKGADPNPNRPKDWCEIETQLVGIENDFGIEPFRDEAEDWEGALAVMAEDITTRLSEAMDWQNEFGLATFYQDETCADYPSINPHEQNLYTKTWTHLIALARDSYDALAKRDSDAATRLTRRWLSLRYPVFRRLALYAATGGRHA